MSTSNTQSGETGPVFYGTANFYGLKFFNEIKDNLDFDRTLPCVPDIFVSDSNTKVLLDYTTCTNANASTYLNNIINGISLGQGFTLENAKYVDPVTGNNSNLSGFYTYAATFDKGIYATTSGITEAENLDKKYTSSGFVDDFKVIFEVENENTTEQNVIKNVFGSSLSPSFNSLGLKTGDFVKIVNGNNSSQTLHEVTNFYSDNNDHEIVQFGNSADFSDENRVGSSTNLRLYRVIETASQESEYYTDTSGQLVLTSNTYEITGLIVTLNVTAFTGKFIILSKRAPNLILTTGSSYIFNTTGLITNEHVFSISSTEDGIWNGGTDHPELVTYDNFVLFNPKTSGTFYYYCKNHPGMGGVVQVKSGSAAQQVEKIPGYVDLSLLDTTVQSLASESTSIYY